MPSVPDPGNVKPWYLRNITEALALDEVSGNVYVRTGFTGNIIISGDVNIPGNIQVYSTPEDPVHSHITEVGTSDILDVPYLPIGGNVVVSSGNITFTNTSIEVTQGTDPWHVNGNMIINSMPDISGNVVVTSGNINANVTQGTNPWIISGNVTTPTDVTQADSTYEMNIARGLVPGQYAEMKNGVASDLSQGTEATIWSQNILYPWASWTTAQKLYIISTSASDTGQVIRIEGLDANFAKITEDVTTNGVTARATNQNFLRINRCYMVTGNSNVGLITQRLTSGTGTVVGSMSIGFARNKGGFFTVPAGYTAYILYGDATSFRGGSGNIGSVVKMFTRTNINGTTTPFMNQFMSEVVNGQYRTDFNIPLRIPEKTDIDVRIVVDGNNTQATCNWEMIMIPN